MPHRYDIEVALDSETADGTKLYFCAGCGRPRAPKLRGLTHDSVCANLPSDEVEKKVELRVALLKAMVAGREPTNRRNRKK